MNANVPNKCLDVHYIACIFAWCMFEWPYTIYGERWPIWIFYNFILFNFIFDQFWPHLIMRMPEGPAGRRILVATWRRFQSIGGVRASTFHVSGHLQLLKASQGRDSCDLGGKFKI
jgi:hypothetical protein